MMKKLLLALGIVSGSAMAANAQTSALKFNLFSLPVKTASVFYEHAAGESSSVQLGVSYTGFSISDTKFSGFSITPEYRFFLTGKAMQGFYVGPYLRYQSYDLTAEYDDFNGGTQKDEATLSTFGGGINLGYQWVFKQRIVLEPFLRTGYNSGSVKIESGDSTFDTGTFDGFGLLPGLNIGIAF
jgi:outer membrane autotransporter protein